MHAVRADYANIVGVDTHARTNTYAILTAATGQVVDTATFPTSPPGLKRAIAWLDRHSEPGRTLVAIEDTNSYGAGITRALRATELDLCESGCLQSRVAAKNRSIRDESGADCHGAGTPVYHVHVQAHMSAQEFPRAFLRTCMLSLSNSTATPPLVR